MGGSARLQRDVLDRGATVVLVAYGINDIGWGVTADEQHKQKYLGALREILGTCRDRKVRVFICSAAITAELPDRAANGFLQAMCDDGLAQARAMGGAAIDVQRSMRNIQRRVLKANAEVGDPSKQARLHLADGVHLVR